ncbi:MAG TPA: EAL domain-containing protein [Pyrinomonadaceae bacterium]|jgi:diguanylate cyclase (GGDEF)-like protein
MEAVRTNTRKPLINVYMWLVVSAGVATCVWAINSLPVGRIDVYLPLLFLATVILGSRVAIRIPRINTNITVDDTFIFLSLLLYGGEAAALLAMAGGLAAGLRISKKPRTVLFAGASLTCALIITSRGLELIFGTTELLSLTRSNAVLALGVMGLMQYVSHTAIVATANAIKDNQSIWHMWNQNFLWISVTYFAGAAAAGIIAFSLNTAGFYAFLVAVPIIAIVYFSYDRYLREVKTSARQAELAERERAEVERQRAEQAERHVKELNNYIAEQDRISRALEETKEHFRHAAFHDSLTGLPNRSMFSELLAAEIENVKLRPDHFFSVLFIDLDRFKNINDSLGHSYGDLLLVAFAERLERILRPIDTLARFGGDEFAILLTSTSSPADALRVADRILEDLTLPFDLNKNSSFTSASIGIALSSSGYDRPEDVLRDADTAMYRAKENGKGRYEVFDTDMHARAVSRLRLERDLRQAIDEKQFSVYYQPIISLESAKLAGFEALVRWNHPIEGLVSPADFIPVAEETGLILPIGQWVLEEACKAVHKWQQNSPRHRNLSLSVNLSGKQVSQPDLLEKVQWALDKSGLEPRFLKLEITESVVMENAEAATAMFKRLRALGVQLSIDDFGTGYSSLSYLHRFPLNYLKIDRSFVSRMTETSDNAEIVKTIVTLAHNLGMQAIAEGVETPDQCEKLRAIGCEFAQGYLFSRPIDRNAVLAMLADEIESEIQLSISEESLHGEVVSVYPM